MKVIQQEDNGIFTLICIEPWADRIVRIFVCLYKHEPETWRVVNEATVDYGLGAVDVQAAREYATAILRACDIAEQLERGESVDAGSDQEEQD